MQYKSLELRVGFTVFIAALALIIGLMWFQGFKIAQRSYEIQAVFPMVGGIGRGDKVNVNGVEMGSVRHVLLRDKDVLVTMALLPNARIPDDSRIVLQTIGIMGERVVTILLGTSDRFLASGATMQGSYDPGVAEALAFLGSITGELTQLTKDMRSLTGTLAQGDHFRKTVENLSVSTERLRAILEKNADGFGAGIQSFQRSAETVDKLLTKHAGSLDTMMTSFGEMSKDLPELVRKLRAVTDSLASITEKLQAGDNTLGALLSDRVLMDRLEKTVKDLDELVTDVRANPKRYLKVEIF
jgi:phospholipid/cholesterol/gamma-HCH transport system substrate-binding protein